MKRLTAIASFCAVFQIGLFAHGQKLALHAAVSFSNKGLVVERVAKNTQAKRAGVRAGDVLLGWKRGSVRGEFKSPFDLSYAFFEQATRGPITITALRGIERHEWLFGSDAWGFSVRPNLLEPLLSMYLKGEQLFAAGKLAEATEKFRAAASVSDERAAAWLRPWFLYHAGRNLSEAHRWDLADAVYEEAIAEGAEAEPVVRVELLRQRASGLASSQDLAGAANSYRDVLREAEKLGPNTMIESNCLLSLAIIELKLGEYETAQNHLNTAMAIDKAVAPRSIQTLLTIANLAVLYQDQGQLEKAEAYYLRSLEKEQEFFPHSIHLERTLSDLGVLFDQQGDLARAEAYHRRALAAAERLDPDGQDVADILVSLAECVLEEGDPARAEIYQKRALLIREKAAPYSVKSAHSVAGLGKIARIRGQLSKAEEYYRRSLAIASKVEAPSPDRSRILIGLAAVLRERGDLPEAETLYRQALAIIEKDDPRSIDRPTTLAELAGTVYQQKRTDDAAQLYLQALNGFEDRALHLGGIRETRSRYRAEHIRYYQEYIRLLLEQGKAEQAFEILESSRARTLLDMLARAHIDVVESADPGLRDREHRLRHLLNAKSEYRMRLALSTHTDQQLEGVDNEIGDLLLQYQQVEAQIRAGNPDYAALTQPQPLKVQDIQTLLGTDSVLLEYLIGEERSYLWAVTDTSLSVYELPKRLEIEKAARSVYDLVTFRNQNTQSGAAADHARSDANYWAAAKRLSQIVLGPVTGMLDEKRLLIVADGALQYIPFSALPEPGKRNAPVPLVVNHEIVNLPSASVLTEIRRQRMGRPKPLLAVAVLADPVFDTKDERLKAGMDRRSLPLATHYTGDLNRSANDLGLVRNGTVFLNRLLYTRSEADAVMAVIPAGQGTEFLDFKASRTIATSATLAKYRIVHFATHGILNNKHPELSGLVLSLVNQQGKAQDGFLKLQDIYNLKLPVDLVVLSGCETGLGEEIRGEGLIGLTRGFMYAGASRVVASLWNVSDMATASLMADFYRAIERNRMTPAAALRAAQILRWRQKQWSSPYYWAAFQIQGEWQ